MVKVVDMKAPFEEGWRIVGLWGDEEEGEGNRIGPRFAEDQDAACCDLIDELEKTYGLPVMIQTIIDHFAAQPAAP